MKISVIIPLYNKRDSIQRVLKSVLDQTLQPEEIIVVNDGSTDGSENLVKEINSPLIHLLNQKNQGVSVARNNGIREARGEWIGFIDADDEWMPDYLRTLQNLSDKYPECDVLGTKYLLQKSDGQRREIIVNRLPFYSQDGIFPDYFRISSISHPPLWTSAVAVKKSAIESIGGFPEGIHSGEDLLTWAKLAANFKIAYSLRPLSVFILDDRITRTPQLPDRVDAELKLLYTTTRIRDIKKYISFWHKMRAKSYVELGQEKYALTEIFLSARWNLFSKAWFFLPFLILGNKIFQKASRYFDRINRK
jgi:glycosyltransferase involved in cell wall biosynthesis